MLQTAENKAYFHEKLFSYGIAGLAVLLLTEMWVGLLYIALGFAHYFMTALYQYKAHRITPLKFLLSALLLLTLLRLGHYFPREFTVFASTFLLLHVFGGEIRHFKRPFTLPYFILTVALAIILGSWTVGQFWPNLHIDMPILIMAVTLPVAWAAWQYFRDVDLKNMDAFFPTLLVIFLVFVFLELAGARPRSVQAFGFITIAHFMTTYYNVFVRFRGKSPQKARQFGIESIVVNIITMGGFLVAFYWLGRSSALYQYFYYPVSFYAWTVLHFMTTWNNDDYGNILNNPGPDGQVVPKPA